MFRCRCDEGFEVGSDGGKFSPEVLSKNKNFLFNLRIGKFYREKDRFSMPCKNKTPVLGNAIPVLGVKLKRG